MTAGSAPLQLPRLQPYRKTAEIIMALYVVGFGVFVNFSEKMGMAPLKWTELSAAGTVSFGYLCIVTALIHSVGLALNGRFRWSPLIRVFALMVGGVLFLALAWRGILDVNTAAYTYGWVSMGFIVALQSAIRDSLKSWDGTYGNTNT